MGLESATYLDDLVDTNPVVGDQGKTLADHIWLLKSVLQTTFPNVDGAVNPSPAEFNYLVGVTSEIQTQLDAKAASSGATLTSCTLTAPTINGDISAGSSVIDDDTMATASDTTLATSESIKAYVDTEVAAVAGVASVQTAYETIGTGEWTTGTGEETRYHNVTLGTTLTDYTKGVVFIQGGEMTDQTGVAETTAYLTSNTNLRICQPRGLPTYSLNLRYYIVEYA